MFVDVQDGPRLDHPETQAVLFSPGTIFEFERCDAMVRKNVQICDLTMSRKGKAEP